MPVKNPARGNFISTQPTNANIRADMSHMRAKMKGNPRVDAPWFFSHIANELSKIPSDSPRSYMPIVISGRLGGLLVHEPLPF